MFDQIDYLLETLVAQGFVPDEDIAWIAVTAEQMRELATNISGNKWCPIRHCEYIQYHNIEFRVSQWVRPEHKLWPVWNITKRTKDYMNKRVQER